MCIYLLIVFLFVIVHKATRHGAGEIKAVGIEFRAPAHCSAEAFVFEIVTLYFNRSGILIAKHERAVGIGDIRHTCDRVPLLGKIIVGDSCLCVGLACIIVIIAAAVETESEHHFFVRHTMSYIILDNFFDRTPACVGRTI